MDIIIQLQGDKFSPKTLSKELDIPIESKQEYGELAKIGLYKGKPSPYGTGWILTMPEDISNNKDVAMIDMLEDRLQKLLDNIENVRLHNVEDIHVSVFLREDNELYLDNKILTLLSKLDATFEAVITK